MPLSAGDIKVSPPIETWGQDGNQTIRVYQFQFTIRDSGSYQVLVPVAGFTPKKAEDAIRAKANDIIATLDAFS